MALTELEIANEWAKALTGYKSLGERIFKFARGIEAEVRKADDALILQPVEALEGHQGNYKLTAREAEPVNDAITAARARLNQGAPQNGN